MGELDNISENAFVAPEDIEISNLNQDIIDALQDDLVTSTTEALPSQFQPEPEVVEEPEVTEERPFRRFRLRRPPGSRNNFR